MSQAFCRATRMMPKSAGLALLALLLAGCDTAQSPSSPTPLPTTSSSTPVVQSPPRVTVTGRITETLTDAAIGTFSQEVPALPAFVTVGMPGFVTRRAWVSSTSPTVDLIRESSFDLEFYRKLARGALGGRLDPLRVLTQAPSFYMEVEGVKGFPAQTAVRLERVARRIVPAMTGGRLQVLRWETGPAPRSPQPGWVMVERRDEDGICGRALVGASAGQVWLDANHQNCGNVEAVFAHEVGHALGFSHVDQPGSMMFPQARLSNLADAPTEREAHHAAIAYRRPLGNRDLDSDPQTSGSVSPARLVVD